MKSITGVNIILLILAVFFYTAPTAVYIGFGKPLFYIATIIAPLFSLYSLVRGAIKHDRVTLIVAIITLVACLFFIFASIGSVNL